MTKKPTDSKPILQESGSNTPETTPVDPVETQDIPEVSEPQSTKKAVVAAENGLKLRRGPMLDVVDILAPGTEVSVLDESLPEEVRIEGWAPVVTDDGVYGWVATAYIKPLEA